MKLYRKLFGEKNSKKKELVAGGTGLAAVGGKVLHDLYKDDGVVDRKGTLKHWLNDLDLANNTLDEVRYLKGESTVRPYLFDQTGHMFKRASGQGQTEAAHNALKYYNLAKKGASEATSNKEKAYYNKIVKKQLKSAEKHARRAVELIEGNDVIPAKKNLVKSYKKLGRNAVIGLGLTAASVAAINKYNKNKSNKKDKQ